MASGEELLASFRQRDAQALVAQGLIGDTGGVLSATGGTPRQQTENVVALLSLINTNDRFNLGGDNETIRYREQPGQPGLIAIQGFTPGELDRFGNVLTEERVEDLGVFDVRGDSFIEITDEAEGQAIISQQAADDVAQQRADTNSQRADEEERANKAAEDSAAANRALSASTSAMSAYLQGTQLADARRLAAHSEARQLLPSLVSPDREFFAGQGPGGFLDQFSQKFLGGPSETVEVQKKVFRPGDLAAGTSAITSAVESGTADIKASA